MSIFGQGLPEQERGARRPAAFAARCIRASRRAGGVSPMAHTEENLPLPSLADGQTLAALASGHRRDVPGLA